MFILLLHFRLERALMLIYVDSFQKSVSLKLLQSQCKRINHLPHSFFSLLNILACALFMRAFVIWLMDFRTRMAKFRIKAEKCLGFSFSVRLRLSVKQRTSQTLQA